MRFLQILVAILVIGVALSVAQAAEDDCPWFEKHKCAKHLKLIPTKEPLVCIKVEVEGTKRVTYHFRRQDRTYYRDPIARTVVGSRSIKFARSYFEQVLRDSGTLKICAGDRGQFGVVFEEEDLIRYLEQGSNCKETIRLTGGVYPKKP